MRSARAFSICAAFCAMTVLLSGCGPGLLALAGGTGGGIFGIGSGGKDKDKGGGGGPTTNTPPAVVVTSLTREDAPATVTYTLIDAEQNLCSVQVAYSTDGINFFPCTQGTGGDMITGLNSSAGGTNHTFEWDYQIDLLTQGLVTGITIAITANDGSSSGQPGTLGMLTVGNDAPVVFDTPPLQPQFLVSGNLVLITFNISDTSADVAGMQVAYTIDLGQTFVPLDPTPVTGDFVGTAPTSLLTTPTGTPGQFIWNSAKKLPSFVGDNVYVVLLPVDRPPGWTDFTTGSIVPVGPISLNNISNGPPEITLVSDINGTSQVGRVPIQFTLTDPGSDSAEVAVEYSVGGGPFTPALLTGQSTPQSAGPFVCTPSPRLYSLEWDALADLGASGPVSVELRLTPSEFGNPAVQGSQVLTGLFTMTPNEAPSVTDFEVFQNSGNITVRINLTDSSAENIDLDITARWNGGTSSFVLTNPHFVSGDIDDCVSSQFGQNNLLIWSTTAAGSPFATLNASDVFWEITPTDKPGSSPSAALTGVMFTTATFPVINDLSGTTPIGINLSEDSGAVTVALSQQRDFTALIQPASALDHSVTWEVVEDPTGGTFGTITAVSSPPQGPQTADYTGPATLPSPNPGFATVRCTSIAAPSVFATYRLYFGDAPGSVSVTPPNPDVVLGQIQQFTASVVPAAAPQIVTWQVVGGSANGVIDNTGRYAAPSVMPGGGRLVTVRATSVKSSVFGEAVVNLQPLPSACTITSNGGSSQGPSQVTLTNTLQLAAVIDPPDAPQSVFWTIDWNGVSQGAGNPTVGTVSASGLYTAPFNLPTPSQVLVRARSQVASSVTDTYQIDLVAPPPTSFTVNPPSIVLSAGGAGQDFDVTNFNPTNANRSVNWDMNPVFGTLDSQTGVYTPPPNSSTTTIVTITATSTVAPSVFATAQVTVQPNQQATPTSLSILQGSGRTFMSGRALQFTAQVLPTGAPQTVAWSVISGPGSINSAGVYSPPTSSAAFDAQCTIQCVSTVEPSVLDTQTIDIDGAGDTSLSTLNTPMGRSEPVAFYDGGFNRVLYCGGYSEADVNRHDGTVMEHDLNSDTWRFLAAMNPSQAANTIAWAHDTNNRYIYAIVGNAGNTAAVYRLDLTLATPTWSARSASGSSDAPTLSATFRYLAMYDPGTEEVYVSVSSNNTIYRLDVASPSSLTWRAKRTGVGGGLGGTPVTEKATYFYDDVRDRHTVIGTGLLSSTRCWYLDNGGSSWNWTEVNTTGVGPSPGFDDGSAGFHAGEAYVFGGKPAAGPYANSLYKLSTASVPYTWTFVSVVALTRTPAARGRSAAVAVGGDYYFYGGKNSTGIFGDLWLYNSSNGWQRPVPSGIMPQGRKHAAATWVESWGNGWLYGGLCDFGVSDEMWRLEYDTGKVAWTWSLESPSGLSTSLPQPLQGASLTYDPVSVTLFLFAGSRTGGSTLTPSNEVFAYNPSTFSWSQPVVTGGPPPARAFHSSAFDAAQHRILYFGGQDGATSFRNDVWMFNVQTNAWSQPSITGTIEGRGGAFAGFEPSKNRMLVLGGVTQATQTLGGVLQLYELAFSSPTNATWNSLPTHQFGAPKNIFPGAGAYDLDGERFCTAPPGQFDNQALVFCHPVQGGNPPITWQPQNISGVSHGFGAVGMYDALNKRFIVFGGENDLGGGKFRRLNQIRVLKFQ